MEGEALPINVWAYRKLLTQDLKLYEGPGPYREDPGPY